METDPVLIKVEGILHKYGLRIYQKVGDKIIVSCLPGNSISRAERDEISREMLDATSKTLQFKSF